MPPCTVPSRVSTTPVVFSPFSTAFRYYVHGCKRQAGPRLESEKCLNY